MTGIQEFAKSEDGDGALAAERDLLAAGLENVQGIVGTMVGFLTAAQEDVRSLYRVGQNTGRLLFALGDLVVAWLLLRQAEVALVALAAGPGPADRAFYTGKVAAARFFARQVLPLLSAQRVVAEATDNDLMDLAEDAF